MCLLQLEPGHKLDFPELWYMSFNLPLSVISKSDWPDQHFRRSCDLFCKHFVLNCWVGRKVSKCGNLDGNPRPGAAKVNIKHLFFDFDCLGTVWYQMGVIWYEKCSGNESLLWSCFDSIELWRNTTSSHSWSSFDKHKKLIESHLVRFPNPLAIECFKSGGDPV